jgi:hypothetical protein
LAQFQYWIRVYKILTFADFDLDMEIQNLRLFNSVVTHFLSVALHFFFLGTAPNITIFPSDERVRHGKGFGVKRSDVMLRDSRIRMRSF